MSPLPAPRLSFSGRTQTDEVRPNFRPDACLPELSEWHGGDSVFISQDNLTALSALTSTHTASVDLVYIDPPFATGSTFHHRSSLREDGEDARTVAFRDRFDGGLDGWLSMMWPRLRLMHTLLRPGGSFYLHVDPTTVHYARVLLDEVFGSEGFQREIIWRIGWISGFKSAVKNWVRNHDVLLYYVKREVKGGRPATFNKLYLPYPTGYRRRDGQPPRGRGVPFDDVWNSHPLEHELMGGDSLDSIQIKSLSREKTGYPTQKNESLLRRIIQASSNPGDLVLDAFAGASTTGVVAASEGRRFLLIDASPVALSVSRARLVSCRPPPSFQVLAPPPPSLDLERLTFESGQLRVSADQPPGARAVTAIYVDLDYQPPVFRCSAFALRDRADERPLSLEFEPPPRGRTLAVQIDDEAGQCARGPLPVL